MLVKEAPVGKTTKCGGYRSWWLKNTENRYHGSATSNKSHKSSMSREFLLITVKFDSFSILKSKRLVNFNEIQYEEFNMYIYITVQ